LKQKKQIVESCCRTKKEHIDVKPAWLGMKEETQISINEDMPSRSVRCQLSESSFTCLRTSPIKFCHWV